MAEEAGNDIIILSPYDDVTDESDKTDNKNGVLPESPEKEKPSATGDEPLSPDMPAELPGDEEISQPSEPVQPHVPEPEPEPEKSQEEPEIPSSSPERRGSEPEPHIEAVTPEPKRPAPEPEPEEPAAVPEHHSPEPEPERHISEPEPEPEVPTRPKRESPEPKPEIPSAPPKQPSPEPVPARDNWHPQPQPQPQPHPQPQPQPQPQPRQQPVPRYPEPRPVRNTRNMQIIASGMSEEMQQYAVTLAQEAIANFSTDKMRIAHHLMSKFEEAYGAPWHCVVSGGELGFFVRYDPQNHIYFTLDSNTIFLFKHQTS